MHALDAVSLQVNVGGFLCLVGPSGCGKTTLLNIIAGLEKPDSGQVLADGKPITDPGRDRMVMFQEPEQLYGDIQKIWATRKKTIVFVTHHVREAARLGNRVILFSSHPGRIREEFKIDLERPRDINSVQLAGYSSEIMRALKGCVTQGGRRMKRFILSALFFIALLSIWHLLVLAKIWSPVLLDPISV